MTITETAVPVSVPEMRRLRVFIRGAVQGVGFRPFVFRLASELHLTGWVNNSSQGVNLEVEGSVSVLETFLERLAKDKPPRAFLQSLESSWLDPIGLSAFEIRPSVGGERTALVLPDIATCPECRDEIFDPTNRRYRYPFTNCTNCGPRFSIIEALPYDRPNTTMRGFALCANCAAEYADPSNRRFHAQPNACPQCGPRLELWDAQGQRLALRDEALRGAADVIRRGQILALKGLGGFQLLVDARQEQAVARLRERKHREEKPFALMFPSGEQVADACQMSTAEERLLNSPEAPIVLLRKRETAEQSSDGKGEPATRSTTPDATSPRAAIANVVAFANPFLGVMLPYTPLHHLLLAELQFPVVATSGNLSDEPICIDETDARQRLGGIADAFLVHNRLIARQVDDSVARVMLGRELVLRRARGYAPLPLTLKRSQPVTLAVGAHLKNAVAMSIGHQAFVSQHIGDLETTRAFAAFEEVIQSFQSLYDCKPTRVACDAHPDYRSSQYAQGRGLPLTTVQHHFAHVLSCMAENDLEPPVLGVAWDGTGLGPDGTIWGGEFLMVTGRTFQRTASFRTFGLPGGEKAIQEPRRVAIGLLYEMCGKAALSMRELAPLQSLSDSEKEILGTMLEKRLNAPRTSSAGRLFDAVASLTGLRQQSRYEGQAAMELEFAADRFSTEEAYALNFMNARNRSAAAEAAEGTDRRWGQLAIIIDWEPMIWSMLDDIRCRRPVGLVAAKFHNTMAEAIVAVARLLGEERIALSGGCFQNRYLTERTVRRLMSEGFRPYWHQRVPPNDGGIALGQLVAAAP